MSTADLDGLVAVDLSILLYSWLGYRIENLMQFHQIPLHHHSYYRSLASRCTSSRLLLRSPRSALHSSQLHSPKNISSPYAPLREILNLSYDRSADALALLCAASSLLMLFWRCSAQLCRARLAVRCLALIIYCADNIDRLPRTALPRNCYCCSSAAVLASFCAVLLISVTCLLAMTCRALISEICTMPRCIIILAWPSCLSRRWCLSILVVLQALYWRCSTHISDDDIEISFLLLCAVSLLFILGHGFFASFSLHYLATSTSVPLRLLPKFPAFNFSIDWTRTILGLSLIYGYSSAASS